MGTLQPGVPYTDGTEDQITAQVRADREADAAAIAELAGLDEAIDTEAQTRQIVDTLIAADVTEAQMALGLPQFLPMLTALRNNRRDVHVLILGDSTVQGDDALKWPGKVGMWLAGQFPTHAVKIAEVSNSAPYQAFDTPTTLDTGTGSFSLNLWNASISGSRSDTMFGAGRFAGLLNSHTVDLIIFCHGHNEGDITLTPEFGGTFAISGNTNNGAKQSPQQFMSRCASVIDQIRLVQPNAPVVVIAQNPELSGTADDQDNRASALATMASLLGFGFIDCAPDMRANAGWSNTLAQNTLMTDSLHPTEAGHVVMADTITSRIKTSTIGGSGGARPPFFERPASTQLLTNPHLLQTVGGTIDGAVWTGSGVTITKDATFYEGVKAYSARLENSGAAASSITQTLAAATIQPYLGKWLCAAARMRVPPLGKGGVTAQPPSTVGTMRIYCLSQYLTAPILLTTTWRPFATDAATNDGWHWLVLPFFVPAATTTIQFAIYAGLTASETDARIYVDRTSVVPGIWPGEP